jgi:hypothetical protein
MNRSGVSRFVVVICALAIGAFALAGCGDKKDEGSAGGGATDTGSGKSYDSGERVGKAKKVVVDSDDKFDAEEQAVIDKIAEFADAANDKDYKKICNEILTKDAQKIGGNCVNVFKQTGSNLKDFTITVKSVTVAKDAKSATADTLSKSNIDTKGTPQNIGLQKDRKGNWRLTILGQ